MNFSLPADLKADCSACVGLCCVIPPFDAVQGFGFDKPAETACRHLCADHRCGIHADLLGQGFAGCVAFDCHGAGQRLTALARQRFGAGELARWRERPELKAWLSAAYAPLKALQACRAQIELARQLSGVSAVELSALASELEAASLTPVDLNDWQRRLVAVVRQGHTGDAP